MRKLISVSAFWRNNHRQGIGVTLADQVADLDEVMMALTDVYEEMYRVAVYQSNTAALVRGLFDQLEEIGLAGKSQRIPIHDVLVAIGNIWLLEKHGFLKSDEFNGILWGYCE